MKTIILLVTLAFSTAIRAQINFSSQVNGSSVTFSITQAGQYYEFITWNFGDGNYNYGAVTNTLVVHTYSVSGNYTVCVIGYPMPMAPNDTACKYITGIITGIHNNTLEDQVHLFPNPVKDKLNVNLSNSNTPFQLTVTNTLGETVYRLDKPDNQQPTIDLSFLTNGVYFIRVQNNSEQKIFRIVKE